MIDEQGLTLIGVAVMNLDDDDAVQLRCRSTGAPRAGSMPRSTRYATSSVRQR